MSKYIVKLSEWNGHPQLSDQTGGNGNNPKKAFKTTLKDMETVFRVQNDVFKDAMYKLDGINTLLQRYYLEHVPVNFEYLKNNLEKIEGRLDKIEKYLGAFDVKKNMLIWQKMMECQAQGKIIGKRGSCVGFLSKDGDKVPIPKTSMMEKYLESLPNVDVDSDEKKKLEEISEKLNLLLFKYREQLPSELPLSGLPHMSEIPTVVPRNPVPFMIARKQYNPITDKILTDFGPMLYIQRYN